MARSWSTFCPKSAGGKFQQTPTTEDGRSSTEKRVDGKMDGMDCQQQSRIILILWALDVQYTKVLRANLNSIVMKIYLY